MFGKGAQVNFRTGSFIAVKLRQSIAKYIAFALRLHCKTCYNLLQTEDCLGDFLTAFTAITAFSQHCHVRCYLALPAPPFLPVSLPAALRSKEGKIFATVWCHSSYEAVLNCLNWFLTLCVWIGKISQWGIHCLQRSILGLALLAWGLVLETVLHFF